MMDTFQTSSSMSMKPRIVLKVKKSNLPHSSTYLRPSTSYSPTPPVPLIMDEIKTESCEAESCPKAEEDKPTGSVEVKKESSASSVREPSSEKSVSELSISTQDMGLRRSKRQPRISVFRSPPPEKKVRKSHKPIPSKKGKEGHFLVDGFGERPCEILKMEGEFCDGYSPSDNDLRLLDSVCADLHYVKCAKDAVDVSSPMNKNRKKNPDAGDEKRIYPYAIHFPINFEPPCE